MANASEHRQASSREQAKRLIGLDQKVCGVGYGFLTWPYVDVVPPVYKMRPKSSIVYPMWNVVSLYTRLNRQAKPQGTLLGVRD